MRCVFHALFFRTQREGCMLFLVYSLPYVLQRARVHWRGPPQNYQKYISGWDCRFYLCNILQAGAQHWRFVFARSPVFIRALDDDILNTSRVWAEFSESFKNECLKFIRNPISDKDARYPKGNSSIFQWHNMCVTKPCFKVCRGDREFNAHQSIIPKFFTSICSVWIIFVEMFEIELIGAKRKWLTTESIILACGKV